MSLLEVYSNRIQSTSSKKDCKEKGQLAAKHLVDEGYEDVKSAYVMASKAKEFIEAFLKELNPTVEQEVNQENGREWAGDNAKLSVVNGSNLLNYHEDEVIRELEQKLKQRKDLIKMKSKQNIPEALFDGDGVEVKAVSSKPSKAQILKLQIL